MKLKRTLALLLAATSLVAMVGCGGSGTSETGSGSQGGEDTLKVGAIFESLGTQSFNDDILAGLQQAEEELPVELEYIEVTDIASTASSPRAAPSW